MNPLDSQKRKIGDFLRLLMILKDADPVVLVTRKMSPQQNNYNYYSSLITACKPSTSPTIAIKAAILNGFGYVLGFDVFGASQIGNGARDF